MQDLEELRKDVINEQDIQESNMYCMHFDVIENLITRCENAEKELKELRDQEPAIFVRRGDSIEFNPNYKGSIYGEFYGKPVPKNGFKLVPIYPTDKMLDAGCDASNLFRVDLLRSYEAMIRKC